MGLIKSENWKKCGLDDGGTGFEVPRGNIFPYPARFWAIIVEKVFLMLLCLLQKEPLKMSNDYLIEDILFEVLWTN